MNTEHQKLLQAIKPNPLPSRKKYEQRQAEIKDKPQYYAVDRYGIHRYLPRFEPKTDAQVIAIAKIRNITIIRKHGNEITEYTPKGIKTNES